VLNFVKGRQLYEGSAALHLFIRFHVFTALEDPCMGREIVTAVKASMLIVQVVTPFGLVGRCNGLEEHTAFI
jgi:hypothetical protein